MGGLSLRSGTPGVRIGLALGASVLLHLAVLLPAGAWLPRKPASAPPLEVSLPPAEAVRELATAPAMIEPAVPAAPPAPSPRASAQFPRPPAAKPQASPKPLTGKALNSALAALTREEFYPREAIARGLEGRVVLLLVLDDAGRVTAIDLASSSGHAILDGAALQAARRIGPVAGGRRQVLLPVEFRLE